MSISKQLPTYFISSWNDPNNPNKRKVLITDFHKLYHFTVVKEKTPNVDLLRNLSTTKSRIQEPILPTEEEEEIDLDTPENKVSLLEQRMKEFLPSNIESFIFKKPISKTNKKYHEYYQQRCTWFNRKVISEIRKYFENNPKVSTEIYSYPKNIQLADLILSWNNPENPNVKDIVLVASQHSDSEFAQDIQKGIEKLQNLNKSYANNEAQLMVLVVDFPLPYYSNKSFIFMNNLVILNSFNLVPFLKELKDIFIFDE